MRTFALLYNLSCGSGVRAQMRLEHLRQAFRAHRIELRPYCSSTPLTSCAVVHAATLSGCEAILAAGGDGTFNDLLQSVMLVRHSLPIGIIPFGSGNVLARELGMGSNVLRTAGQLARAAPQKFHWGCSAARRQTAQ